MLGKMGACWEKWDILRGSQPGPSDILDQASPPRYPLVHLSGVQLSLHLALVEAEGYRLR